jgi:PST family polysaccharide transporter
LGAPEATWLIRLLALNVLVDGVVAVPNALITRALQQRKRLLIDTIAFFTGTPVTIFLAARGYGAWSLGWGAIIGTVTTGVLAILWAPERYLPGWRREVVPGLIKFGLPLAGSSLLLLLLLNIDYMVVGHMLGASLLGVYVLAFNVCSWPISVITASIRRVTLAAFARMHEHHEDTSRNGFANVLGLVLAVTLPVCACLAAFAPAVVHVLYGARWAEAAEPLRFLVVLAVGRIVVELTYDYLAAVGRGSATFWLHLVWLLALAPALVLGCRWAGLNGAASAHALVVVAVAIPLAAFHLRRSGVRLAALARSLTLPVIGTLVIIALAALVTGLVSSPYALVAVGPALCAVAYALIVSPMRRRARELWAL